jgi:hypothetical protein
MAADGKDKQQPSSGGVLSDELKNIMSKKFGEPEDAQTNEAARKKIEPTATTTTAVGEEKPATPTGWAKYFTREHGWKISFFFFTGLFGALGFYILIEWGAPRRDENNLIVSDRPL